MLLMDKEFPRTLDELVEAAHPGGLLEAWTFDDRSDRLEAERRLAARGVRARIRSAYKPLLHAFLEEVDLAGVERVVVRYPTAACGLEDRFRLEAYPLAALLAPLDLRLERRADNDLHHEVILRHEGGGEEHLAVFAPNRRHADAFGQELLSPTGWLRREGEGPGERLETEFEALFSAAVEAIAGRWHGAREPFFEELRLRAEIPARDLDLAVGDEVVSLAEALHEDLYFTLLERFQKEAGTSRGDRSIRPGQIVPHVTGGAPVARLRIEVVPLETGERTEPPQDLAGARTALSASQIRVELDAVGGDLLTAPTRAGRRLRARHVRGSDFAVMISGGQHANETTGIVGALRAGRKLAAERPDAHFVLSPLENPDGYALHRRLVADNPRHMHHAARYTAFGDDMEYRRRAPGDGPLHETEIRHAAVRASGCELHVTLHGYPAHEWTRPFGGYVPAGFELWTLPKGFFLILRHHPGWRHEAQALLEGVTRRLAPLEPVLELTRRQLELFRIHAGDPGLALVNGFPAMVAEDERSLLPVALITEYPDETIHGPAFELGHTAQMAVAVAAYEVWQEIMAGRGVGLQA